MDCMDFFVWISLYGLGGITFLGLGTNLQSAWPTDSSRRILRNLLVVGSQMVFRCVYCS